MKTNIELAHEAGMLVATSRDSMALLDRFAELVRADQRERDAAAIEEAWSVISICVDVIEWDGDKKSKKKLQGAALSMAEEWVEKYT